MILLWLQLVEFAHCVRLHVIGYVYVGLHRLVVAVPRPFHHHLCGNAERKRVADECPSSGMGAQQRVFGCNGVYTLAAFIVGFAYWLVDFRKFPQFFQVVVHLLVADDWERLVSFKLHVLVFVKYRPAVVVQFDDKAVSSLYGGDFYIPVPNVAPFEVVHVRIAQPAETAEQKDVPYPFEILLGRGVSCNLSVCSVLPM